MFPICFIPLTYHAHSLIYYHYMFFSTDLNLKNTHTLQFINSPLILVNIAIMNKTKITFVIFSFNAHILAIEPILFVMVTRVARARSSRETEECFSFELIWPKL